MGGNLQMLMKFRDLQVAEDVGKKAALGYFEVEFTMYGCAYLDRKSDRMKYRISSMAEDIYCFIEDISKMEIYPSKVEELSLKCLVPLGTKELIAQDVKRELAKELKKKYSKEFFKKIYSIADSIYSNDASLFLWQEAEQLEGKFEEIPLQNLESLVEYMYSCKQIFKDEYIKLRQWIADERTSMDENYICKDIFEKTMYGFAYIENDSLRYTQNAQADTIYRELYTLEQNGVFVSPVYKKTFWYNYNYRLKDVMNDYKNEMKAIYNIEYMKELKEMRKNKSIETQARFSKVLDDVKETYGEDAMQTLLRYGYRWGVL